MSDLCQLCLPQQSVQKSVKYCQSTLCWLLESLRACFMKHGKVSLIPWNRRNVVRQAWRSIRSIRRRSGYERRSQSIFVRGRSIHSTRAACPFFSQDLQVKNFLKLNFVPHQLHSSEYHCNLFSDEAAKKVFDYGWMSQKNPRILFRPWATTFVFSSFWR